MKRKTLSNIVSYIGAAVSSGQGLDGVQNGSNAIRNSGVFNLLKNKYQVKIKDHGDIHEIFSKVHNELYKKKQHHEGFKNLQILDPTLEQISLKIQEVLQAAKEQEIILTVGGDHSVATGSIHGMLSKYQNLKVIWVDAHADILDADKTDYTGYHGTPLAHILGVNDRSKKLSGFQWMKRRLKPQNVVQIGWRQINQIEFQTMKQKNIRYYTPDHIDMYGIGEVMRRTFEYLDPNNDPETAIHISFDIDALDPEYAGATGTTTRGGLTPREANHIIRRTVMQKKLVSMDLVQINPALETKKRKALWADQYYADQLGQTVGMGADLIESLYWQGLK